jgi:hypothetical protein
LIDSTVKFLDYRVACIRHREEEEGEAQKKITRVGSGYQATEISTKACQALAMKVKFQQGLRVPRLTRPDP